MPSGDGTGPNGNGPMSGRGLGFCNGYSNPGFVNRPYGRGYNRGMGIGRGTGRGFGRGIGWRNNLGWYRGGRFGGPIMQGPSFVQEPINPDDYVNDLKTQKEFLEQNLKDINEKLEKLSKKEE
jgi:hypothetical protein